MGKSAKAFVVGTSLPATAITLSYVGLAQHRGSHPIAEYELVAFVVPLLIGTMNAASIATQDRYGTDPLRTQLAFGALAGLTMSLLGRSLGMPSKLFNIPESRTSIVHFVAPVLYAGIFALVLGPLNKWLVK